MFRKQPQEAQSSKGLRSAESDNSRRLTNCLNPTGLPILVALVLVICLWATHVPQEASAIATINIWKHRYPFYGGYGGYYPFWGGYGGGYGGIGIGGYGGYGRR